MRLVKIVPSLLRFFVFVLLLSLVGASQSLAGEGSKLFSTSGLEGEALDQLAEPAEPYIKRSRPVTVLFQTLESAGVQRSDDREIEQSPDDGNNRADSVEPLLLNLFPDVELEVIFTDQHGNKSGSTTWTGKVTGNEDSLIILIVKDGVLIGNISVGNKQYIIRYLGGETHVIHEIDQSGYPSEADPDPVEYPASPDTSFLLMDDVSALDTQPLDGKEKKTVIDVMVVYTAAARLNQGSTTAINNLIDLAVSETNTGYTNSGISQMLNLVHTAEVSYAESGNIQTDRDRLKNPSDGFMDNVHTLRNTHAADLVALIVDNGGSYCGIAFIMTNVSTQFEDSGFCVVADECATGYYSFGHELGHLMGARHDWFVDGTDISPYTYNHGLTNPTDSWRTIMAYNDACTAVGSSCNRLLYWSNPDKTYGGDAMGTREADVEAKDNRKTLANTAFVVANFRVKNNGADLSEEFASTAVPDNSQKGVMFDLKAKKSTTIHGFSTIFSAAGVIERVEIYYKKGSYTGHHDNPSAWTLAESVNSFTAQASPAQTHIPIDLDITIPAGQTYAFYITTPLGSADISYTNGTSEGATYKANASLELKEGRGISYPFAASFSPRVFAGTIYHSFAEAPASLKTAGDPNNGHDGVMFDVLTKHKVIIKGFSAYLEPDFADTMEIWYRKGTYVGHVTTAGDWTLLGVVDNVVGSNSFYFPLVMNRIPLELNMEIPAGQRYGFYITQSGGARMKYRNGTSLGAVAAENGDLAILEGTGVAYPFGSSFSPRVFTGSIFYTSQAFPWSIFMPGIINSTR
jgi:hypothetical protein